MAADLAAAGEPGPVAVGGIGGSGTRLVARILLELGLDLGPDRNESEDNLWFTLLLRGIPARARCRGARVNSALEVFIRAMRGAPLQSARHRAALMRPVLQAARPGSEVRPRWALERAGRIRAACARPTPGEPDRLWGWKEPNTHVFLPELSRHLPLLRYIHVIRDGSEVAGGRNRAQLRRWGPAFGIDTGWDPVESAYRYWLRANVRALIFARERLDSRFLLVEHGSLCRDPQAEIDRISGFLGISVEPRVRERLIGLPDPAVSRRAVPAISLDLTARDRAGLALLGYA